MFGFTALFLFLLCPVSTIVAWRSFYSRINVKKMIPGALLGVQVLMTQPVAAADPVANGKPVPQLFGLKKGRLLPCKQLSNCISSSSVNSIDKFGNPWEFGSQGKDGLTEFKDIKDIISDMPETYTLVDSNEENLYLHATAKSVVPPNSIDDIEFLINPLDKIITYRSNSREVIVAANSVLSDNGSNKNRLQSIKRKLGVKEMGTISEQYDLEKPNFFRYQQAASLPNEINFIDNSVPGVSASAAPVAKDSEK